MPITSLRITDFRNLASAELIPILNGLNIICGKNGSGKTSLLEAIHYLGLGRSFRSSLSARLIRHETEKFSLFTQVVSENECVLALGVERDVKGGTRLKLAEKDVASVAELAAFLPIRTITSQSHQLFESGPLFRRKYLDWGLFYENNQFFHHWRQFERALKQRNAVLRDKRSRKELDSWTEELAKYGVLLDELRKGYVQKLTPVAAQLVSELLPFTDLSISYYGGWKKDSEYAAILAAQSEEDYRVGHTQYGPHRADLDIKINSISAKHILSRGQQKLLICAMILAQGMVLAREANKGLIYLVDDLPSELDSESRQKLVSLLAKQNSQIFITAIESDTICNLMSENNVPRKVFHVEHGNVQASA